MNTSIVPGSIEDLAQKSNQSIAATFLTVDAVVLIDVSGSMAIEDARGDRSRYDVACEELANLQGRLPGKIAVVAFSSFPQFVPNGRPPFLDGGTDMAQAMNFVKPADGCVKFILISDGEPNNEKKTLEAARSFQNYWDTIYIGPECDRRGADFLQKLAKATGGKCEVTGCVDRLADQITLMLG
jgi:Mg-chelatase subunit ChlD